MEQNKHRKNNKKQYSRVLAIVMAMFLLLGISTGVTLAYLVTTSDSLSNHFLPAEVEISVEKNFSNNSGSGIVVKNIGETAVYIRVALVPVTDTGSSFPLDAVTLGEGWMKYTDGYYYYKYPVAPSAATANLLGTTIILEDGQTITVLAQAIQANPSNAVTDAWGSEIAGLLGGN